MEKIIARSLLLISVVTGLVLLTPFPARADCTDPVRPESKIIYSADFKVVQYCDGTKWIAMHAPGTAGGSDCTDPAKPEGSIIYNADYRVMQACSSGQWRAMGPMVSGGGGSSGGIDGEWTHVDAGATHTCGIKNDGTAWCWGDDDGGRLGNGAITGDQASPSAVDVTGVSGSTWTAIAAGGFSGDGHSCGIRDDGIAWCWGADSVGQLGNGGTTGDQTTPSAVDTAAVSGSAWTAIAAGEEHSCGIRDDGTGWCWGDDSGGRLGNGAITGDQASPSAVDVTGVSGSAWTAIEAGRNHSCGIRDDGTAWCWGGDSLGQLGNGASGSASSPSPVNAASVSGSTWTAIAAGNNHNCAIRDDGTAWCWGTEDSGQLGNGGAASENQTSPSAVDAASVSGTTWTAIAAGNDHSCGIRDDATAWCWGADDTGQLGNGGTTGDQTSPSAVGGTGWTAITAAGPDDGEHTCAIRNNSDLYCWGTDGNGQLGNGTGTADRHSPVEVLGNDLWIAIATGVEHSCGIKTGGTAWCWGRGHKGQLGNGAIENQASPMEVDTSGVSGTEWTAISAGGATSGNAHSCGLRNDGTMWCWGSDSNGQIGNGATTGDQHSPVAIDLTGVTGTAWTALKLGNLHSCGIRDDGTAWCWGSHGTGQVGDGSATGTNKTSPKAVNVASVSGTAWTEVAPANPHTCGLRDDGTAWCWGSDGFGNLGNGSATSGSQTSPVAVDTTSVSGITWIMITAGNNQSCGIRDDGTAWCWGNDSNGALGNGATSGNQISPSPVDTAGVSGTAWTAIEAGSIFSTCGIRDDNSAWCWGVDDNGELGNGSTTGNQPSPVGIDGGGEWMSIEVGSYQTCGLKGTEIPAEAWCWGSIAFGQLGVGEFYYADSPANQMQTTTCSSPARDEGTLLYNSSNSVMQYCNGMSWISVGK